MPVGPTTPVQYLKGVGPKTEKALQKQGILSVEDLLCLLPLRYEDRRCVRPISDAVEGRDNVFLGQVVDARSAYSRAKRKRLCSAVLDDGSGTVTLTWFRFHKRWISEVCGKGNLLLVSGKVARYGANLQMIHPTVVVVKDDETAAERIRTIIPIYPEIKGITQGLLRNIMEDACSRLWTDGCTAIPPHIGSAHRVAPLAEAFRRSHFLDDVIPDEVTGKADRERITLEEFFLFQLAVLIKRREMRKTETGPMLPGICCESVRESFPFSLTAGQEDVVDEIARDMSRSDPMNRLLQGDVGSGKTVCAILAAAIAADSGYQTGFLAPTEILAEQHYMSTIHFLRTAGISCGLLTGGMGAAERRAMLAEIREGSLTLVFGTHAMLQSDVVFDRLGLVVIDEQHRFGVVQRSTLKQKGKSPHVLVMSATPIPRSLSMVLYGDLDLSLLNDKPGGARTVETQVITNEEWRIAHGAITEETDKGRQVFVVCPVLEESEETGLRSAKENLVRLQHLFPSLRIGLIHGRMRTAEKQEVMYLLREGLLDVLVSTTVVEVGIDVPNATLMVIEHAERFGLSQLHQLRGRIGRGPHLSRCILISASTRTAAATKRLRALERTNDGFVIAEEDMKLRGIGDMIGVRQAGLPDFKIGDMVKDSRIMSEARKLAAETLAGAQEEELSTLKERVRQRWGERLYLSDVL